MGCREWWGVGRWVCPGVGCEVHGVWGVDCVLWCVGCGVRGVGVRCGGNVVQCPV